MISGGVDVPALQVECLVVVCEARVRCPISVVSQRKCGTVAPVEEVASNHAGVVESWDVVEG